MARHNASAEIFQGLLDDPIQVATQEFSQPDDIDSTPGGDHLRGWPTVLSL
jgi:hypothetical protein